MISKIKYYGFTLFEVLMALGIIFIIVSLYLPSFSNYLLRVKVKGAHMTMIGNAQFLERWKSYYGTYKDVNGRCPDLPYQLYPENKNDAAYFIDSQQSTCFVDSYIIRAVPICNKAKREDGDYSCLCLISGDSINEEANLQCINDQGTCQCIHLK